MLARAVKDFACRLRTMQGWFVERRAGWDTHGLPVEIEAERRLGLEGKKAIEELGIARFNAECRASVFRYIDDWRRFTERMGYWVDLDHPYVTCSAEYVTSVAGCSFTYSTVWPRKNQPSRGLWFKTIGAFLFLK